MNYRIFQHRFSRIKQVAAYVMLTVLLGIYFPGMAYDPYIYEYLCGENGCVDLYYTPDGPAIGSFYNGTRFWYNGDLYPDKNGWVKGYFASFHQNDGIEGWLRKEDLIYKGITTADDSASYPVGIVNKETCITVMEDEFRLADGVRVFIIGTAPDACYVRIAGTLENGWIKKTDIDLTADWESSEQELVTISEAQLYGEHDRVPVYYYCDTSSDTYFLSKNENVELVWHGSEWSLIKCVRISEYTGSRTCPCYFIENRFLSETGEHASDKIRYVSPSTPTHRVLLRPAENSTKYIAKLNAGMVVYIIKEGSKWCYVKAGDSTGYVQTQYLQTDASGKPLYARTTEDIRIPGLGITVPVDTTVLLLSSHNDMICFMTQDGEVYSACISCFLPQDNSMDIEATVTSDSLRFRILPSKSKYVDVVTSIGKGKKVVITILGDTWSQIRYQDTIGYVMTKYLEINTKYIKDTI